MNIEEWIEYGIQQGYVSQFCYMHDLPELRDDEVEDFYNAADNCIPTLRVFL